MKKTSYLLKQKYTQRWTYSIYFCFLGLVLLGLYMNKQQKADKQLLPHRALSTISSDIKKTSGIQKPAYLVLNPVDSQSTKSVKATVRPLAPVTTFPIQSEVSGCLVANANALVNCSQSAALLKKNSREKSKDSLKTLDTLSRKSNRVVFVRKNSIQQTEIMIPCFADKESLKMYQERLLQSGIRLDLTGIVYGGRDANGMLINTNAITYCNANIYLADTLYKSVQLKNFKEFRIKWDTYNTGEVNIKSVSMLDNNYLLKKF